MVNSSQSITIIAKRINLDVSQISEYAKKTRKLYMALKLLRLQMLY